MLRASAGSVPELRRADGPEAAAEGGRLQGFRASRIRDAADPRLRAVTQRVNGERARCSRRRCHLWRSPDDVVRGSARGFSQIVGSSRSSTSSLQLVPPAIERSPDSQARWTVRVPLAVVRHAAGNAYRGGADSDRPDHAGIVLIALCALATLVALRAGGQLTEAKSTRASDLRGSRLAPVASLGRDGGGSSAGGADALRARRTDRRDPGPIRETARARQATTSAGEGRREKRTHGTSRGSGSGNGDDNRFKVLARTSSGAPIDVAPWRSTSCRPARGQHGGIEIATVVHDDVDRGAGPERIGAVPQDRRDAVDVFLQRVATCRGRWPSSTSLRDSRPSSSYA